LLLRSYRRTRFPGSKLYWERRYDQGGSSGAGSYGRLALYKAEYLNDFVAKMHIQSVIEYGCGDGHQLSLMQYPSYIGLDVSASSIFRCVEVFSPDMTKSFLLYNSKAFMDNLNICNADMSLSLDVIYHLVEDETYDLYMRHLFSSSRRFVVIYSSNESKRWP